MVRWHSLKATNTDLLIKRTTFSCYTNFPKFLYIFLHFLYIHVNYLQNNYSSIWYWSKMCKYLREEFSEMTVNPEANFMHTLKEIRYYWISKILQAFCNGCTHFTSFSKFVYDGIWVSPCALFTKQIKKHLKHRMWRFVAQTQKPDIHDLLDAHQIHHSH